MARLVHPCDHESLLDILIFQSAHLDLHIFSGFGVVNGTVTGIENLSDLEVLANGADLAVIVHTNATLFDFPSQEEPLVSDLVHDGDTQGAIRVTGRD